MPAVETSINVLDPELKEYQVSKNVPNELPQLGYATVDGAEQVLLVAKGVPNVTAAAVAQISFVVAGEHGTVQVTVKVIASEGVVAANEYNKM